MRTEFKVGDRVRCDATAHPNEHGTITEYDGEWLVKWDCGILGGYPASKLELVDPPAPEPAEWTPGDGWSEAASPPLDNSITEIRYWDGEKAEWHYWTREAPVPPLPTEPYTVIRVDWRDTARAGARVLTHLGDGKWLDGVLGRSLSIDGLITGFKVLSEPRAVTARAVLDQVEARGSSGAWHTTLIKVVREFGAEA